MGVCRWCVHRMCAHGACVCTHRREGTLWAGAGEEAPLPPTSLSFLLLLSSPLVLPLPSLSLFFLNLFLLYFALQYCIGFAIH